MHENPTLTPAEEDRQIDSAILALLIDSDAQRPWSTDEITREIGEARRTAAAGSTEPGSSIASTASRGPRAPPSRRMSLSVSSSGSRTTLPW